MDPVADELIARLRRNPEDAEAFARLKAYYHQKGDFPALANLVEGWAARQRDRQMAASGFYEAAALVARHLGDRGRALALCERALERNPAHQEAAAWLEQQLDNGGDHRRLAAILERRAAGLAQLRVDPRHLAQLHHRLGELWQQQLHQSDRAVYHYRRAFELDASLVPAIYAARELYRQAGNLKAAAALYEMEAHAETDSARQVALLRELAVLHQEHLGDLEGAIAALEQARGLAPSDLGVMHDLATAYLRRADQGTEDAAREDGRSAADLLYQMAQAVPAEHALAYAESALDAMPDHDGAMELLEHIAEEHGRQELLPPRWVGYLRGAPEAPGSEERRRRLGHAYLEAEQAEDAITCLEPLLDRGDPQAAEMLVDAYRGIGREEDATRALAVVLSALPPAERLPRLREMIRRLLEAGDRSEAARRAHELLELDPSDAEALRLVEDDYRARGELLPLRDHLLNTSRMPGLEVEERKRQLREVAVLSEEELGDAEGAIGAWGAVLGVDPADAEARDALVRLFERAHRWDELVELLERDALTATDATRKAELFDRLATIHRSHRRDPARATEALRHLHKLRPDDHEARDALCDALLEAGSYGEAVPLLQARIEGAADAATRIQLRRTLVQILDERLDEHEQAFAVAAALLGDEPGNLEALDWMERLDTRTGRYDRLLETLSYRTEVVSEQERMRLLHRMAEIARDQLDDLDQAAEYYRQALEHDPNDKVAFEALYDLYDRSERYRDLVVLLREMAHAEQDTAIRASLYRRIAGILAGRVRNEEAAAEAWEQVLSCGEDEQALRFLRGMALQRNEPERLVELSERLARLTTDAEERRDLRMEQADLLAERLGRQADAADVLRDVLAETGDDPLALQRLVEVSEATGDERELARALEQQLSSTEEPALRATVSRRLADLYQGDLDDRDRAIGSLYAWADADPGDPMPRRRLVELLETDQRWEALLTVLDSLASVEPSPETSSEVIRRAAEVAADHLDDVDSAWERLEPLALAGDEPAESALRELAHSAVRGEALAGVFLKMAHAATDPAEQKRRWLDSARSYAQDVGDPDRALEATLRALALDLSDETLLDEVDQLAEQAAAWERLGQVYETLLRNAGDDRMKVRMLVRHARLLDLKAGDPSGALDRVLRACALVPEDDELVGLAEDVATRAERAEELLVVYDRRRQRAEDAASKNDAMLRAARLCDALLQDRQRALDYLSQAVASASNDTGLLDDVEAVVAEMDQRWLGARTALVDVYWKVARHKEEHTEFASHLLLRAARMLADEVGDPARAFEALARAGALSPTNEILDQLEALADRTRRVEELETHLSRWVDEALDSATAARLLRRQARILEALGNYENAGDVYRKLLSLVPDDQRATVRVRECMRKTGRFQDLLIVLERQLEQNPDEDRRIRLLKEVAATWEDDLKNRWEALDAWKRVLATAPDDPDAEDAVKRLGHSTRRLSASEVADVAPRRSQAGPSPEAPDRHTLEAEEDLWDDETAADELDELDREIATPAAVDIRSTRAPRGPSGSGPGAAPFDHEIRTSELRTGTGYPLRPEATRPRHDDEPVTLDEAPEPDVLDEIVELTEVSDSDDDSFGYVEDASTMTLDEGIEDVDALLELGTGDVELVDEPPPRSTTVPPPLPPSSRPPELPGRRRKRARAPTQGTAVVPPPDDDDTGDG